MKLVVSDCGKQTVFMKPKRQGMLIQMPFLRYGVAGIHLILISWDRATKLRLTLSSWNRATELRLSLFPRSDCQRLTLKSVTCLMRLGTLVKGSSQATSCFAAPRLPEEYYKDRTRHRPFDHTSPCSGRPIWTNQICAIG